MSEHDNKIFNQQRTSWYKGIPRDLKFILPEKYRKTLKRLKIFFTLASLLFAFFFYHSIFIAYGFGLAAYLVLSGLERNVITYSCPCVHFFPDFKIEPEKWAEVFWGFERDPQGDLELPLVELQFTDDDYARKMYALLLAWSSKDSMDENNIKMSAILMDDDTYVFFCYPDIGCQAVSNFYAEIDKQQKQALIDDLHHRVAGIPIIAKKFNIRKGSYFPVFRRRYRHGTPFLFQFRGACKKDGNGRVEGTDKLFLRHLKIRNRGNLEKKEMEYDILRLFDQIVKKSDYFK